MESRLLARSATSGRFDDNQETIRKRLRTFNSASLEVIRHYMEQGKVTEVDSAREFMEVYLSLEKSLKERGLIPEPGA
jgi:adenylate kinase family enzyme